MATKNTVNKLRAWGGLESCNGVFWKTHVSRATNNNFRGFVSPRQQCCSKACLEESSPKVAWKPQLA